MYMYIYICVCIYICIYIYVYIYGYLNNLFEESKILITYLENEVLMKKNSIIFIIKIGKLPIY